MFLFWKLENLSASKLPSGFIERKLPFKSVAKLKSNPLSSNFLGPRRFVLPSLASRASLRFLVSTFNFSSASIRSFEICFTLEEKWIRISFSDPKQN